MEVTIHRLGDYAIAEINASDLVIRTTSDALDLLGDIYYQGFGSIILYEKNITADFFDLKTGIAGEILQKFSTYRVRLAIVGTFDAYTGKSIKDFIYESNKMGHINFVPTLEKALDRLSTS